MSELHFNRIVGQYDGNVPGPGLLITGGLHGNEAAGLLAAERVLGELRKQRPRFAGTLTVAAGNLAGLKAGRRFIERDLNRRWTDGYLQELVRREEDGLSGEDREQVELFRLIQSLERRGQPLMVLDLHTTSGQSPPFVCFSDTLANRRVAMQLALPSILGLEEVVDASMLGWLVDRGHIGIAIEGGKHDSEAAIGAHTSAIWLFLAASGALRVADVPGLGAHRTRLAQSWPHVPAVVEIRHRHTVGPDDSFVMRPGFRSFEWVRKGQVLAEFNGREVRAAFDALLLMPRYQPQGEDGFFLAAPVRPIWLSISKWLRHMGVERLVPLLPGISPHPTEKNRFVVAAGKNGWVPPRVVDVMHICGYRRRHSEGELLVFSRRGK